MNKHSVKVWDPVVRLTHWLVASLFLTNYWLFEAGEIVHEWVGYCIAGLVILRVIWGVIGSRNARIASFFPTPSRVLEYLKNRHAPWPLWQGHNPLGGLMILFFWCSLLVTAMTGWMQTTDTFWGEEWVQQSHEVASLLVLVAAFVHVLAVVLVARYKKVALIEPMITGRRRFTITSIEKDKIC